MRERFRPIDLAREGGVSAASVRSYERDGFLPPAERTASGHRRYGARHLDALRVSRALMRGYGWQYARHVMHAVHRDDSGSVVSLVDARHAALDRDRREVEAAVRSLRLLSERAPPARESFAGARAVRVGEAARLVGVRPSAMRFWEREGLVRPRRDAASGYRLYDRADVDRLHLIVVLRDAGYRPGDIRQVLDELGSGNPAAALARAQRRAEELARLSLACMEATAALWGYLSAYVVTAGET
jgi:DNA-binding transcriptional MerR regulator